MKIAIHAPYGALSEETGVIVLLARHLQRAVGERAGAEVVQLRCSGAFSLCDRDAEGQWKRGIDTCFRCMHEQRELAAWGDFRLADLTSFLSASQVIETRKWISYATTEELLASSFDSVVPSALISGSFKNRFGVDVPNVSNRNHEQVARRYMLAALRTSLAARRFVQRERPDVALVAAADDFISRSTAAEFAKGGVSTAVFTWDIAARVIKIQHPTNGAVFSCALVLEGIASMRSDARTWPAELASMLDEIVAFLEIPSPQIALKVAQS